MTSSNPNRNFPLPQTGRKKSREARSKLIRLFHHLRSFEQFKEERNLKYPQRYNYKVYLLPNGQLNWTSLVLQLRKFSYWYALVKWRYHVGRPKAAREASAFLNCQRYQAHRDVIILHLQQYGCPSTTAWNYRQKI